MGKKVDRTSCGWDGHYGTGRIGIMSSRVGRGGVEIGQSCLLRSPKLLKSGFQLTAGLLVQCCHLRISHLLPNRVDRIHGIPIAITYYCFNLDLLDIDDTWRVSIDLQPETIESRGVSLFSFVRVSSMVCFRYGVGRRGRARVMGWFDQVISILAITLTPVLRHAMTGNV